MEASVYWLHLPTHMDILTEGYVGVAVDPKRRFNRHVRYAKDARHENPHLLNAIIKSGNTIMQDIVAAGSQDYCYKLEKKLRPNRDIGWNIAEGGDKPPNSKGRPSGFKGYHHTEEEKERRRNQYSGKGNPFYGKKHTPDENRRAGVKPPGFIPGNAIAVKYKGREYSSIKEASRKNGVSVYYIQKEVGLWS